MIGIGRQTLRGVVTAVTAGCVISAIPTAATARSIETSTELRRLDMMLMATSLGCRFGADDFRAEYNTFRTRFLPVLRDAALAVTADLSSRLGSRGATNAFDRMSVEMANHYGAGHPQLSCRQLKQATAQLATMTDEASVLAMTEQLLPDRENTRAMLARR